MKVIKKKGKIIIGKPEEFAVTFSDDIVTFSVVNCITNERESVILLREEFEEVLKVYKEL